MKTFADFVRAGELGPLAIGVHREDVRRLLGEPESTGSLGGMPAWRYGALDLTFFRDRIYRLALRFLSEEQSWPAEPLIAGWHPSGRTSPEEFRAHLASQDIKLFEDTSDGEVIYFETHEVVGYFERDGDRCRFACIGIEAGAVQLEAIFRPAKTM